MPTLEREIGIPGLAKGSVFPGAPVARRRRTDVLPRANPETQRGNLVTYKIPSLNSGWHRNHTETIQVAVWDVVVVVVFY
jgi:hypothetical protein